MKTYVLDTNVILYSPGSILSFSNAEVIIPEIVLEELDNFKQDKGELGRNARHTARILDDLRKSGNLKEGVELPGGGILKVEINHEDQKMPSAWDLRKADNRIIQVCVALKNSGKDVRLITKDVFERIKADTVGIIAEDFAEEILGEDESLYTGRIEVYTSTEGINRYYSNGFIESDKVKYYNEESESYESIELCINQFVLIKSFEDEKRSALGRFDGINIVTLSSAKTKPLGIQPMNTGQKFMLEALLLSPDMVPLTIIKGPAGTGKTLISLAAGLYKIMDKSDNEYRKILICRPSVTMGEEIGFLPGTEQDKIAPFLRPIFDNLDFIMSRDKNTTDEKSKSKIDNLFNNGIITAEAVAYLRGRSIENTWIIIDEAQNLTPKQIKTIVTRAGEGSKIILIGDPEQIDQPFLNVNSNGLSYVAEKMKGSKLCAQVSLKYDECRRSQLALEASMRL